MKAALLVFLAAAALPLQAAMQVQVAAEPGQIYIGQQFQLKITVQGGKLAGAPQIPEGPYDVGPISSGSQIYIVNSRRSETYTYSCAVRPNQAGTITIPAFKVTGEDGAEHTTKPVAVTVKGADKDPNLFVELAGPERTIYPEQELNVTLTVFAARLKAPNAGRDPFPQDRSGQEVWPDLSIPWIAGLQGLASSDGDQYLQGLNPQVSGKGFRINNLQTRVGFFDTAPLLFALPRSAVTRKGPDGISRDYFAYMLKRPFRGKDYGDFGVAPVVAQGYVLHDANGTVEYRKFYTVSNALTITVSPPPDKDRPASFSGAVGAFRIKAAATTATAAVGDPIGLTLTIDGQGTFDRIAPPALATQPGFEKFKVYDQPTADNITDPRDKNTVIGKTFTYRIRPTEAGNAGIPPVEFTSFDPAIEKYVTLKTEPLPLTVEEGKTLLAEDIVAPKAQETTKGTKLEATGRGIAADHDGLDALQAQAPFNPFGWSFLLLGVLPPLLYAAGAGALLAHRRLNADPVRRRARTALSRAHARLGAARRSLGSGDAAGFYPALAEAVSGFIADRLALPEHGLTAGEIRTRLASEDVPDAVIAATIEFLERCDAFRFSPAASGKEAMTPDLARAGELLDGLRRAL